MRHLAVTAVLAVLVLGLLGFVVFTAVVDNGESTTPFSTPRPAQWSMSDCFSLNTSITAAQRGCAQGGDCSAIPELMKLKADHCR